MEVKELEEIRLFCKTVNLLYVQKERNDELEYFNNFFNKVVYLDDGLEALEQFNKNRFQILITDIEIKSLNGFDLIENCKKLNNNLITIIYTRNEDKDSFLKTINLKIDGYIMPPFSENKFLEILYKSFEKCKEKKVKKEKKKKSLNLLKQYNEIVDKNSIISKTDKHGIITFVNDNFCKTSEYKRSELIGKSHNVVRHPDNPREVFKDMWNTIRGKKSEWTGVIKNLSKTGKTYYIKTTIKPILDINNEIVEYISVRSNVTTVMSDKKHLIDRIESNNLFLLILIQIEDLLF